MKLQPWQQQIFDKITSGGIKPKEMILMTADRNIGKSQITQQAIDRLMRDLNSQPISEIVTAERRLQGSRFYTAEPIGGNWLEMETWVTEQFGPNSSVWDLPEHLASCRWIANDRRFWFRREEDRTLFLLKWR